MYQSSRKESQAWFIFDAEFTERRLAEAWAEVAAEDGVPRYLFPFATKWYVSRIIPPPDAARIVDTVIPQGASWRNLIQPNA